MRPRPLSLRLTPQSSCDSSFGLSFVPSPSLFTQQPGCNRSPPLPRKARTKTKSRSFRSRRSPSIRLPTVTEEEEPESPTSSVPEPAVKRREQAVFLPPPVGSRESSDLFSLFANQLGNALPSPTPTVSSNGQQEELVLTFPLPPTSTGSSSSLSSSFDSDSEPETPIFSPSFSFGTPATPAFSEVVTEVERPASPASEASTSSLHTPSEDEGDLPCAVPTTTLIRRPSIPYAADQDGTLSPFEDLYVQTHPEDEYDWESTIDEIYTLCGAELEPFPLDVEDPLNVQENAILVPLPQTKPLQVIQKPVSAPPKRQKRVFPPVPSRAPPPPPSCSTRPPPRQSIPMSPGHDRTSSRPSSTFSIISAWSVSPNDVSRSSSRSSTKTSRRRPSSRLPLSSPSDSSYGRSWFDDLEKIPRRSPIPFEFFIRS